MPSPKREPLSVSVTGAVTYTNLKSNPLGVPFNKLYKAIYNYFKGLEYKRNILT